MKHLHPVAHTYDIGIYFEANGHGTVLFSYQLLTDLEEVCDTCDTHTHTHTHTHTRALLC